MKDTSVCNLKNKIAEEKQTTTIKKRIGIKSTRII